LLTNRLIINCLHKRRHTQYAGTRLQAPTCGHSTKTNTHTVYKRRQRSTLHQIRPQTEERKRFPFSQHMKQEGGTRSRHRNCCKKHFEPRKFFQKADERVEIQSAIVTPSSNRIQHCVCHCNRGGKKATVSKSGCSTDCCQRQYPSCHGAESNSLIRYRQPDTLQLYNEAFKPHPYFLLPHASSPTHAHNPSGCRQSLFKSGCRNSARGISKSSSIDLVRSCWQLHVPQVLPVWEGKHYTGHRRLNENKYGLQASPSCQMSIHINPRL